MTFIDEDGRECDYENPLHITFVTDMETEGIPWRHYSGRFYYEGPAAESGQFAVQEIMSATKVPLQTDDMGLDKILYPR